MNTKSKNELLNNLATILETIWRKNQISKEFIECGPDEKYFNDSCRFSNLSHEIFELSHTLRKMAEYSTMIKESEN